MIEWASERAGVCGARSSGKDCEYSGVENVSNWARLVSRSKQRRFCVIHNTQKHSFPPRGVPFNSAEPFNFPCRCECQTDNLLLYLFCNNVNPTRSGQRARRLKCLAASRRKSDSLAHCTLSGYPSINSAHRESNVYLRRLTSSTQAAFASTQRSTAEAKSILITLSVSPASARHQHHGTGKSIASRFYRKFVAHRSDKKQKWWQNCRRFSPCCLFVFILFFYLSTSGARFF